MQPQSQLPQQSPPQPAPQPAPQPTRKTPGYKRSLLALLAIALYLFYSSGSRALPLLLARPTLRLLSGSGGGVRAGAGAGGAAAGGAAAHPGRAPALASSGPAPPYRHFMTNQRMDSGTEKGELYRACVPGKGPASAAALRRAPPHSPVLPNLPPLPYTPYYTPYCNLDPYFEYTLFPPDGHYPVSVVADAFVQCDGPTAPSLVLMSRHYQRTPDLDHTLVEVELLPLPGALQGQPPAPALRLPPGDWFFSRSYETLAIGTFALPPGPAARACAAPAGPPPPPLPMRVTYRNTSALLSAARSPQPPRSQFAMVAVFSFSRFLLRLWLEYYYALGVDTFYLFYNGDTINPTNVTRVAEELAGFRGAVVLMEWRMLHWIQTDGRDITCGQPVAINNALQRWRHLHQFMLFYDLDEFLVLPRHRSLAHFVAEYSAQIEPIVALRSMCSWGQLNLTTPRALAANISTIADVALQHLAWLPVERGRPGGREKYLLNTSAVDAWGIRNINLHGVYSHQGAGGRGGGRSGEPSILAPEGGFAGYHLHILNVPDDSRRMDSREIFLSKTPIINDELAQAVRKGLVERVRAKRGGAGGEKNEGAV